MRSDTLAVPWSAIEEIEKQTGNHAGLGMGIGFILVITALGSLRELFGNGTIFELSVFGENYQPALLFILPPGGFLTIGFLMAVKKKYWKAA